MPTSPFYIIGKRQGVKARTLPAEALLNEQCGKAAHARRDTLALVLNCVLSQQGKNYREATFSCAGMAQLSCRLGQLWVELGCMKTQLKLWETYLPRHSNTPKTGSQAARLQEEIPQFCTVGSPSHPASLAETGKLCPRHPPTASTARCPRYPRPACAQQCGRSGWTQGHFSRDAGGACTLWSPAQRISREAAWGAEPRPRALPKASGSHPNHTVLLQGSREERFASDDQPNLGSPKTSNKTALTCLNPNDFQHRSKNCFRGLFCLAHLSGKGGPTAPV